MRRAFQLDDDQRDFILKACALLPGKNVPDDDRVNRAWDLLGKHMGFDGRTCEPESGLDETHFTAEVIDESERRTD